MAGEQGDTAQMSEVLRLIGTLSDAVLDAQIMNRPIPEAQVKALNDAALLLQEHRIALPPMLLQALHGLDSAHGLDRAIRGRGDDAATEIVREAEEQDETRGLARFLRPFRNYRS